ncbi:MAG: DUF2934 domain-containing protein [Janthinobacterium lividum]
MPADTDDDRIAKKAYEIWESEGRPHGRDQLHWDEAKEIVALHDSMGATLLPRDTGAFEPEEPTQSVDANGDIPGLTDQGRDDLVDTDREPEITKPSHATYSLGDTVGHVARSRREETPDIDDDEIVTPAPKVAPVTPTPSKPMLGVSAPRPDDGRKGSGAQASPTGNGASVTGKVPPRPPSAPAPVTKGKR